MQPLTFLGNIFEVRAPHSLRTPTFHHPLRQPAGQASSTSDGLSHSAAFATQDSEACGVRAFFAATLTGAGAAIAFRRAPRRKSSPLVSKRERRVCLQAASTDVGSSDGGPANKQTGGFGFDESLKQRFFEVAQPFFLPSSPGKEAGGFGVLLAGLVLGVAATAFLLLLGLLNIAIAVPQLAALFPTGAGPDVKIAELATSTNLGAAAVAFGGSSLLFWTRREDLDGRWRQWGLLGLLIFLLLCVTGINVVVSYVFRSIDNVMVAKNEAGFYQQLQIFVAVLVVAVPTIASYRFVRLTLANSWREFLTMLILGKYFEDRKYYLLDSNSTSTNIDNPDQRISEDVDSFTSETLGFLLDILGSVSNLISFSAILWATSEQLTYALIAYAIFGTFVALAVGGELIGINYEQLRLQADFRYSLVHVRDNAEAIAFYQGEAREKGGVGAKLQAALRNYDRVIQWTTGLTIYQKIFFYVARLVPYFVVGGLYFAGKVDFGTLGQVTFAFSMVLSSVTLIVSRIQDISRFSAGVNRLGVFYEAIVESEQQRPEKQHENHRIATDTHNNDHTEIQLDGVSLWTPTGRTLVEDISFELGSPTRPSSMQLPSRLLVVGSSGVGKSSILRAVAGLWTQGQGRIRRPDIHEMLFLPQKPYMPLGDLRTQLVYPSEPAEISVDDAALVAVLEKFGLGDLPHRFPKGFDETLDWTRVLSLGEQQRLAAARCLVAGPRLAVLDEATSALPVKDERNLYLCLQERNIGYISVGHRPSLVEYHDLVLELLGEGRWRIMSPREYEAATQESMAATSA